MDGTLSIFAIVFTNCCCGRSVWLSLPVEAGYFPTSTSSSAALLRPQQQQHLLLLLHREGEETNGKDEGGRITGVGGTIHRCVGGKGQEEKSCCKKEVHIINFGDGQKYRKRKNNHHCHKEYSLSFSFLVVWSK